MRDLISRRAAIKAIDDLPNCYNGYSDTYDKAYIIGTLEEVPPIEPKHGEWILITNAYIDPQEYMCSVCGRTIKYYGIPELLWERYPYCNCGAKMKGGECDE